MTFKTCSKTSLNLILQLVTSSNRWKKHLLWYSNLSGYLKTATSRSSYRPGLPSGALNCMQKLPPSYVVRVIKSEGEWLKKWEEIKRWSLIVKFNQQGCCVHGERMRIQICQATCSWRATWTTATTSSLRVHSCFFLGTKLL